jgi:hypothetical protein
LSQKSFIGIIPLYDLGLLSGKIVCAWEIQDGHWYHHRIIFNRTLQEKCCKYYFPRISKLFKMKFGLNIPWMVLYKSMVLDHGHPMFIHAEFGFNDV